MELLHRATEIGAYFVHASLERDQFPAQRSHVERGDPAIHVTRIEPAFGDVYGVCACGEWSLPYVSASGAAQWECPWAVAAVESMRARHFWERRIADAHMGGYTR